MEFIRKDYKEYKPKYKLYCNPCKYEICLKKN